MFYSHDILTSRKYGVATVWLVATLGAKSGTKKVTRKAILNVDVKKACETIMEPEAPLALRLQSNLLYGVTKVNNQQAEYLLLDTQAAQHAMRSLLKTARSGQLDPNAGKALPEQLMLMDDPAFAIDNALPALAFDFDLDNGGRGDSQRSTQSMLSIRERSGSVSSLHAPSVFGLNISSSSNGNVYQLPDPLSGSSAQKPFNAAGDIFNNNNDEEMLIMEDDLFDYDADGNMRDIPASERVARQPGILHPQSRLGSDSGASGRVRKEHEDALTGRALPIIDGDGDFGMQILGDEYDLPMLPDAEPFPVTSGALGSKDRPPNLNDSDHIICESKEASYISAEAPQKRKRAKKAKFTQVDQTNELKNADLSVWQKQYLDNMTANKLVKAHHKSTARAKKNAFHYVYGRGINGVGEGVGDAKFESPLVMFSGAALLAKLTGIPLAPKAKRGAKRAHENQDENEEHSTPSKRPALEDEVGRGYEDSFMHQMNDQDLSIEVGRDAPSALPDIPSSAMPWNQSASLISHQRGASSSLPGRMGSAIGVGRRMTSASPLVGRGSALPSDLDQFEIGGYNDDMQILGREDSALPLSSQAFAGAMGAGGLSSSQAAGGTQDFELFGAAAAVDTQTAADPQWVRSVLDRESNNFLEYVKNSIDEKLGDELNEDHAFGDDEDERTKKSVTFEELFEPERNSHVVAAQAFYHILSLATKNRVWVTQEINEEFEPFGEISIGVHDPIKV